MKKIMVLGCAVLLILGLAGCSSVPLPAGMDEAEVLEQGEQILGLLLDEDWEAVAGRFREDVRESISAADVEELVESAAQEAGVYQSIQERMTNGQDSDGEQYGVAGFLCQYSEEKLLFRMAFDLNMELIGISIQKV